MSDTTDDSPPVERYYTYAEIAAMLRVKPRTVQRLAWSDDIKRWRHKRSHVRLVPESTVLRWLKARMVEGRSNLSRQERQMA